MLGAIQSVWAFRHEAAQRRTELASAAVRSAADARARMEAADILLQTLAPGSVGLQCARRLDEVTQRIPGYLNLMRFDRYGRVVCAAKGAPADPGRASRDWFTQLRQGERLVATRAPGADYASQSSLLAAARAETPSGEFDGAMAAVISLSSLRPNLGDRSLPQDSQVALTDSQGRYLDATDPAAFPPPPEGWTAKASRRGAAIWYATDSRGERRVYSAAPLVGKEIFVVLSARSQDLVSWAWLNPLTGIGFPLLTFLLALGAVWIVADRVVIRWIAYLQRIAAIYARGRLSVRALQAEQAPPEIRDLAETLEGMADAIVGRDASLRDSLAQKDALMREIHHRVKNNLQVISSLLSMQQRSLTDPAARSAMSDTRQRISALALIYRALYQGPDLKQVDLRPFLEDLTGQLIAGEAIRGAPVKTELHIDPLIIDPDRLAPLALFAVEAITNAQKHAFAGRGGTLTVVLKGGEAAELSIADDGPGGEEAAGAGVGRTLMTAFARQLRGYSGVERNCAGGVTAWLVFPVDPAAPPLKPSGEPGSARGVRTERV
ncbi:MAG: sensor histidine kinase [Caulobacteraceae bacterium]|nr:sensor histidine kinase [Caulobacteraceae bacterium]